MNYQFFVALGLIFMYAAWDELSGRRFHNNIIKALHEHHMVDREYYDWCELCTKPTVKEGEKEENYGLIELT